jgi:hypothetical protein
MQGSHENNQDEVVDKVLPRRSARSSPRRRPNLSKATTGEPKRGPKSASNKKKPAINRGRGRAKKASDDDDTDDEKEDKKKVIASRLDKYHCADRSLCVLGMQQPIRPAIDTSCRKCKKPLHIECGYSFSSETQKRQRVDEKECKTPCVHVL